MRCPVLGGTASAAPRATVIADVIAGPCTPATAGTLSSTGPASNPSRQSTARVTLSGAEAKEAMMNMAAERPPSPHDVAQAKLVRGTFSGSDAV